MFYAVRSWSFGGLQVQVLFQGFFLFFRILLNFNKNSSFWSKSLFSNRQLIFLFSPFSTSTSLNQWHLHITLTVLPAGTVSLIPVARNLYRRENNSSKGYSPSNRRMLCREGKEQRWWAQTELKETLFYWEGDQALAQVTQRGCGVSILGNTQKPGHVPGQLAVGDLAWAEGG